jgi:hypothetical protein
MKESTEMPTIHDPNAPVQTPWETAVATVANRAKAALDDASYTRIDKAVALVLAGGVTLTDTCKAYVASQSRPLTQYTVEGSCPCRDFPTAPSHLCTHKLAAGLQRRAMELAEPPAWEAEPLSTEPAPVPLPVPQASALPEAPASVNCYITLHGRQVQITLRDTDEARLLQRLSAVLAQYPVPDMSASVATAATEPQPTPDGWCLVHGVQMRKNSNDRGVWWSHKHGDQWCRGKGK